MDIYKTFETIIDYLKLFQWQNIDFIYNLKSKRTICEIDKKLFDVNLFIDNLQFERIEDWKYIHWWNICVPTPIFWSNPLMLWNIKITWKYAILNWNIVYKPIMLTSSEDDFHKQKELNEKKKFAKSLAKIINNTEEIQNKIKTLYKNLLTNHYNLYSCDKNEYVMRKFENKCYFCKVTNYADAYNTIRNWWTEITNILDSSISYETILKFIKDWWELVIWNTIYLNDWHEIINTNSGLARSINDIKDMFETCINVIWQTNYWLIDDLYLYNHVWINHKYPFIFVCMFESLYPLMIKDSITTELQILLNIRDLDKELKWIDESYIESQIDAVLDLPEVNNISYKSWVFTIKTNDIWINKFYSTHPHSQDINAWPYEINVSQLWTIKVLRLPNNNGEHNHPHVHRNWDMCTDSFEDILKTSSKKLDILSLAFNIINHLQTYNESSPYSDIEDRWQWLPRRPLTWFSLDKSWLATSPLHIYIK